MLSFFLRFFDKTAVAIEENPAPVRQYLLFFVAILGLRLTFEFFSSRRLFTTDDVIHIGLWFIFIVLAFLLQLHLFSKVSIKRTIKLVVTSFIFALSAPLLDLLLTGGIGAKMNYLSLHSWRDVLVAYATIGGPSMSQGATPGIRIEIALLVLACFNYVRVRQQSWRKGLVAAWSIYTVLFLSGTIPLVIRYLANFFNLKFTVNDNSTTLFLLSIDLFLIGVILWRYNPATATNILKNIPIRGVLAALLCAGGGFVLARFAYPANWALTPTTLFWPGLWGAMAVLFGAMAGLSRVFSLRPAALRLILHTISLFILIIPALMQGEVWFGCLLLWSLLYLRDFSPLNLYQCSFFCGPINGGILLASSFVGFMAGGGPMIGFFISFSYLPNLL